MAILIAVMVLGSSTAGEAQTCEPQAADCSSEWVELGRRRPLPFDPLTFEAPAIDWEQLRDRRWWAGLVVEAVVAAGLLTAESRAPAAEFADSLMRQRGLQLSLPIGGEGPRPDWNVRLRLGVKGGGPNVALVVSW